MRASADDAEVVVRTEIRGKGDPIQLDYRLEKDGAGWKIYDVNVLGVWLVENYRNSFAQEIGANGIDGLIAKLAERNKAAAAANEELMLLLPATLTSREARDDAAHAASRRCRAKAARRRSWSRRGSLQQLDSAALAVLLEIQRLALAWGSAFAVRGVPAKLAALAKLYGVDVLLLKPAATPARRRAISASRRRSPTAP